MKVKIDKSRKVYKGNLYSGRINENKYEVLEFEFPQELEDFTKYIEIEATDNEGTLRYADRIEDNEFAIDNTLSKYSLITAQVVCKDLRENVVFKSNPFEFTFEQSLNIMEDIEEEQQDLLDRIELELQEAKEDITYLQETEAQHTEQIQTNASNIENLQERVATNETDIANIKTKNTQQDTTIETNTQDINNIKAEQTTQNANITSNTNRITVLESQSGNKVILSINSNYVMTLQLLNKNNEVLSTGTIDLPIESMIVNASYRNGILTLTLQNGQTLNVDISDIVSGLVSETTFNNVVRRLEGLISGLDTRMTTAETNIAKKVDKVAGKGLSTEDYTTAEKTKLANLENYDDTEVKADIEALEEKHDEEVAELQAEIEELKAKNEEQDSLIPTDTPEPSSNITINDSARYTFKKFEVGGNSEQESYEGNSIYKFPAGSRTNSGLTGTIDNDNNIAVSGTATSTYAILTNSRTVEFPAGTYTFAIDKTLNNTFTLLTTTGGSQIGRQITAGNKSVTFTTTDVTTAIEIRMATTSGNSYDFTVKLMIANGENKAFEPYVGGQAAPNSDYPQEIRNVSGSVDVKVENKNLFNDDLEVGSIDSSGNNSYNLSQSRNKNYILLKQNTEYTISTSVRCNIGLRFYDKNKNYITNMSAVAAPRTFTMLENAYYLRIVLTTNDLTNKVQIEQGSTSTEYIEHEEQTVTFPTKEGQVLHLGDTLEDDGVHQRRAIKVLDGTESFEQFAIWGNYHRLRYLILNAKTFTTNDDNGQLSSHFSYNKTGVFGENSQTLPGIFAQYHDSHYFYFVVSQTSLAEFKAWLAQQYANGTPVTLEYELAEEIIVPYNEEQQEVYDKIKKLYSYKGTTHISSDNNLSPIFNVTYRKDYTGITDARLDALEQAILSLGGNV